MIHGNARVREIKKQQREAIMYRLLSTLWTQAQVDNPDFADLYINRVDLSTDGSVVRVLFYSPKGQESFTQKLDQMKLVKPSMRKALAVELQKRYTPDLFFVYDEKFAKQQRVEELLHQISTEQSDD